MRRIPPSFDRQAFCGPADLVRASAGDPKLAQILAPLFGYQPSQIPDAPPTPRAENAPPDFPAPTETAPTNATEQKLPDIPFWRLRSKEWPETELEEDQPPPAVKECPNFGIPKFQPLCAWSRLLPRLRSCWADEVGGRAVDLPKVVDRIARAQTLDVLPTHTHRRWGQDLVILCDRSVRMTPFFEDQRHIIPYLSQVFPIQSVQHAVCLEGEVELLSAHEDGTLIPHEDPKPGSLIVVLGDLGVLAPDSHLLVQQWENLGQHWRDQGSRTVALTPAPPTRWPSGRLEGWQQVAWDPNSSNIQFSDEELAARKERLLRLLSPAIRIEPGLLRQIRLLLGSEADAGTEADVWQDPIMAGRFATAGTLSPKEIIPYREQCFQEETPPLIAELARLIRSYRGALDSALWAEELYGFPFHLLPNDMQQIDRPWGSEILRGLSTEIGLTPEGRQWNRRRYERVAESWYDHDDIELRKAQLRLDEIANPNGEEAVRGWVPLEELPKTAHKNLSVIMADGKLQIAEENNGDLARCLAELETSVAYLSLEETSIEDPFWKGGKAPEWAHDWGWDEYGAWVSFRIDEIETRLRWCPPGSFLMGSPDSDTEALDREKPQHEVQIEHGYWLFEAPCTQELWLAVMGKNPSHFDGKTPYDLTRPVEQVSWHNAQDFFKKLAQRVPGLSLGLPSEAMWEYACRAGSGASRYGKLEESAWYRGNADGQPHPVKEKRPNEWGLYDMLGNVLEWCEDDWHSDYVGAPTTGSAWKAEAQVGLRVLRGGSWGNFARSVRSACRSRLRPDNRLSNIGFRPAWGQGVSSGTGGPEGPVAEPTERKFGASAEHATSSAPSRGARLLSLREERKENVVPLPSSSAFILSSDRERLTVEKTTQPDWADAIGRDKFGLWTEIAYKDVRQKLRWIPPGKFMMGSPEDEPGRSKYEGPRHEVTIGQGFWLFDTPCTQAMWEAVMGDNPSYFQHPKRPVEHISWDQTQEFFKEFNRLRLGLTLSLPSEAMWEYACRAGTDTALYSGPIEILGERDAPALDDIAWYGGNCGQGFELEKGWDMSHWDERQYTEDKLGGTHKVAQKQANGWGLYDMLGNVWEWCEDDWQNDYAGAPTTGSAWKAEAQDGYRVQRGGSWISYARYVRSACPDSDTPGIRSSIIGFRPACGQVVSSSQGAGGPLIAERTETGSSPGKAELRRKQGSVRSTTDK